jgi:hypothetical protein
MRTRAAIFTARPGAGAFMPSASRMTKGINALFRFTPPLIAIKLPPPSFEKLSTWSDPGPENKKSPEPLFNREVSGFVPHSEYNFYKKASLPPGRGSFQAPRR